MKTSTTKINNFDIRKVLSASAGYSIGYYPAQNPNGSLITANISREIARLSDKIRNTLKV